MSMVPFNKSLIMRKPAFCICENKDADQLRSNCAADQRLCFRYTDCTIPTHYLNPKFQASSHLLWLYSPVCVGTDRKPRRPVFSQRGFNIMRASSRKPLSSVFPTRSDRNQTAQSQGQASVFFRIYCRN